MLDAEIQYVLARVVSPPEAPGIRMTCEVHAQTTPEFGRSPWEWMASPREFSTSCRAIRSGKNMTSKWSLRIRICTLVFESLFTSKRVYKPINQSGEVRTLPLSGLTERNSSFLLPKLDNRYTLAEMNTIVSRYAPENTLLLVLRHIPDGCTR